jgi:DNA-binding transcriptional LysR family regulator
MQDLNDLYYFVQVVDHGGFAAAGRALGLPKSKLSRRIGVLEDRLGVRLIQRSSRRFSVTDIGQEFHRQCLAMLVEAEAAQAIIDNVRMAPQGTIRMTCPPGLLAYHIGEAVARFLVANPRIEIQLKALNRRVDVIGEGYDLAVRAETSLAEPATLVTRKLGETSHCLVVAPALLADRPTIAAPPGLAELPSIDFGLTHPDHPQGRHEWRLRDGDGNVATGAAPPPVGDR